MPTPAPDRAAGEAFSGMKIGRAELARLRKTHGLVVQGMDQSSAVEMTAQLAEAHAKHAEVVAALKSTNDQLALEIQRLKPFEARVTEQEQTIADLRARIAKMSAPNGQNQGKPQPQAR